MLKRCSALFASFAFVLLGCSSGSSAPLRSPALDYSPPAATTPDGDTVGADRRGPGDKLQEGVSSNGPAPGWKANQRGLTYDPKQRVGGAIDPPAPTSGAAAK